MPRKYSRMTRRLIRDICVHTEKRDARSSDSLRAKLSVVIGQVLNALDLTAIDQNISNKGDDHKDDIDNRNDCYMLLGHGGHHDQKDQTQKEYSGADLAGDQCAVQDLAFSQDHAAGDQLEAFLYHESANQIPKHRIPHGQTQNQSELSRFVSNRIQQDTQGSDHVEPAGNFTVNQVCQTGDSQNGGGNIVVAGLCGV